MRPLAHGNIAPPIVLGQALAFASGHRFDLRMAALAHGFGLVAHATIVFANDYADREADALHASPTIFSGGSRVLVEGKLRPRELATAAWLSAGGLTIGSLAAGLLADRPWLFVFAIATLLLLFAYSLRPLALSYRGFGEIAQGLGVGLVLPLLGYYAQAGGLSDASLATFAPLVILGIASNIFTALPDTSADALAKKATWPVRRGERRAAIEALALVGLALVLAWQLTSFSPMWMAIAFGAPALLALVALRYLPRADAAHRDDGLRFVGLGLFAITWLHLGWSAALFLGSE